MLGLVQNTATWTCRKFPSIETLQTFSNFDPVVNLGMNPSGPIFTFNLPSTLSVLTGKGFPFWNGERNKPVRNV